MNEFILLWVIAFLLIESAFAWAMYVGERRISRALRHLHENERISRLSAEELLRKMVRRINEAASDDDWWKRES